MISNQRLTILVPAKGTTVFATLLTAVAVFTVVFFPFIAGRFRCEYLTRQPGNCFETHYGDSQTLNSLVSKFIPKDMHISNQ